jgi:hypothetical protein
MYSYFITEFRTKSSSKCNHCILQKCLGKNLYLPVTSEQKRSKLNYSFTFPFACINIREEQKGIEGV